MSRAKGVGVSSKIVKSGGLGGVLEPVAGQPSRASLSVEARCKRRKVAASHRQVREILLASYGGL
jgi:hypothetical protein